MDLFSDLPTPSKESKQVPPNKRTLLPNSGTDLFGDLPATTKTQESKQSLGTSELQQGIKRKLEDEDGRENNIKEINNTNELYTLRAFVSERKGEREEMQDAHVIMNNFHKNIEDLHSSVERLALYAVFDGHGGARASKFGSVYIPANLAAKFPKGDVVQVEKDMKKCFLESFKKTDEDFLKEAAKNKPSWKDGTTSITVLAINNTLYIANLGDSKAIICRYNNESKCLTAIPLSKDHSPTDYSERMRIQKAGGSVRDGRVLGVLEVSRSIGDGQFKTCGVICVPDIKRCQLTENDKFVVLACDGLWKVFSSDEVVEIINDTINDKSINKTGDKDEEEVRCEAACTRLVNEAVRKLSGDNVTVIIVLIKSKNRENFN